MLKTTARVVRGLLESQRILGLAVTIEGIPVATLVPFLFLPEHRAVMIHASRLSLHTRGLTDGGQVGIVVHEQDAPDRDPLQLKRVSFECRVSALERDSGAWIDGRDRYLARFPSSRMTFRLKDFTLYRLGLAQGRYFGGFGRAVDIDVADIEALATSA